MSVETRVFLHGSKLPSRAAWAEAIRSHGFDLDLHAEFDPEASSGFQPCTYESEQAGFEYFLHDTDEDELDEYVTERAGDKMANFVTHSDLRETVSATVAARSNS